MKINEFTYNPELVLRPEFNSETIEFDGVKIGQNTNELSIEKISEYYDINGINQNLNIKNGWVLMDNGIQYILKNGLINMVRIKKNGLKTLSEFDRNAVEKIIGKADNVADDGITWVWDYVVEAKIHNYNNQRLKFHYSTENGKICELEIGEI